MTAHELLKEWRDVQWFIPLDHTRGKSQKASNGCLYRWLREGAVIINDAKPKPEDQITFPIKNLIFFPKGNRRTII